MILEARQISKSYPIPDAPPLNVFKHLDFHIREGERVSLMGPSGSGKTTLLSILAGLDSPSEGEVFIAGKNFYQLSDREQVIYRSSKIGIIFQQFHLMPFLNALENVMLPLQLKGSPEQSQRAEDALKKVGLEERLNHLPHQLSRGECQRVAVARVIASRPSLILADEPTGSLDKKNAELVLDLILRLIEEIPGSSLLLVTHDPSLAQRCERRYYIEGGLLTQGAS